MSQLIGKIENNAIVNLRVADDDELIDNVHRLINAISHNTSIESIHFEREFLGCLRGDARSNIIEAVGKLPNLHEVHMGQSLLQISGITKMLLQAKSLRVLKLEKMVLQGVESDFEACKAALYAHMTLKEFEMKDCDAAVGSICMESLEMAGKKLQARPGGAGAAQIQIKPNAQVA